MLATAPIVTRYCVLPWFINDWTEMRKTLVATTSTSNFSFCFDAFGCVMCCIPVLTSTSPCAELLRKSQSSAKHKIQKRLNVPSRLHQKFTPPFAKICRPFVDAMLCWTFEKFSLPSSTDTYKRNAKTFSECVHVFSVFHLFISSFIRCESFHFQSFIAVQWFAVEPNQERPH